MKASKLWLQTKLLAVIRVPMLMLAASSAIPHALHASPQRMQSLQRQLETGLYDVDTLEAFESSSTQLWHQTLDLITGNTLSPFESQKIFSDYLNWHTTAAATLLAGDLDAQEIKKLYFDFLNLKNKNLPEGFLSQGATRFFDLERQRLELALWQTQVPSRPAALNSLILESVADTDVALRDLVLGGWKSRFAKTSLGAHSPLTRTPENYQWVIGLGEFAMDGSKETPAGFTHDKLLSAYVHFYRLYASPLATGKGGGEQYLQMLRTSQTHKAWLEKLLILPLVSISEKNASAPEASRLALEALNELRVYTPSVDLKTAITERLLYSIRHRAMQSSERDCSAVVKKAAGISNTSEAS